ncbi:hypothetical protein ACU686_26295 [Yinghuangia aomiensis]
MADVDAVRPVAMYLTRRRRGRYVFTLVVLDLDRKGRTPRRSAC